MGIDSFHEVERICREEVDGYVNGIADEIVAKRGIDALSALVDMENDELFNGYGKPLPDYSHLCVYFANQGIEPSRDEMEWYENSLKYLVFEGVNSRVSELQECERAETRRDDAARIAARDNDIPRIRHIHDLDPNSTENIDTYIITADPKGDTGLLTLLSPCFDEDACDYGTYQVVLGDGGTFMLKDVDLQIGSDAFGRCTNEDDDGNIVEHRSYEQMANDAYEMSVKGGKVYNGGIPVCIGHRVPCQPDPLEGDSFMEMEDSFYSLDGSKDLAGSIIKGMKRSRELLNELRTKSEKSSQSTSIGR